MTVGVPQKAWMAGVLETRGKVRFTNDPDRRTNQLVLQVRTSHIAVVERLCELTGTKIDEQDAKKIRVADRRPCVEHCQEAHSHVVAEIPEHAVWAISGTGAAIVLLNLMPFFVTPAGLDTVADNVLAGLPTNGRGRQQIDATIIRLRKLGWNIPPAALKGFVGIPAGRSPRGRFVKQELTA